MLHAIGGALEYDQMRVASRRHLARLHDGYVWKLRNAFHLLLLAVLDAKVVQKLEQIFVSGRVRAVFGVAALLDGNTQDSFKLLAGHNGSTGQPTVSEVCLGNEGQRHTNLHGKAPPPRRGLRHGTLD